MNKEDRSKLESDNYKLNNANFKWLSRIKKLKRKLNYTENLKAIWLMKDKIKELERRILLNEQQVRFNLIILANKPNQ